MSTPSLINDRYSGFDSPGLPPVVPNLASGPSSRGRSYYRSFYTSIGPALCIVCRPVKRGSRHGPAQAPRPNPLMR
jgi:hypothetical protein